MGGAMPGQMPGVSPGSQVPSGWGSPMADAQGYWVGAAPGELPPMPGPTMPEAMMHPDMTQSGRHPEMMMLMGTPQANMMDGNMIEAQLRSAAPEIYED